MSRCRYLGCAVALVLSAAPALAADPLGCSAPTALAAIDAPLPRTAARLARGLPLTIVAIGSSSTRGTGASDPALNYPSRLQDELQPRLPGVAVRVINRGKGGEDVGEEVERLAGDVIAEHPDLVIWQVGTNAVLRRDDLAADGQLMHRGVGLLTASGSDVVLMDLQYAPRVLERPAYAVMEELIAETADQMRVGLFHRFALMRQWQGATGSGAPALIGADGLHMTDASYGCLAADLAEALAANWQSAQAKLGERQRAGADVTAGIAPSRTGALPKP